MIANNGSSFSLDALAVFACAAKHLNFTHTARELNVTQAAVSRRIAALEQQLGTILFSRESKRKLQLTRDGERLNQAVITSLSLIDNVVQELKRPVSTDSITITTTSGFASLWLLNKLSDFSVDHPQINVRLVLVDDWLDLLAEDIDMGIRYGSGKWTNTQSKLLFAEQVFPVCSPGYLNQNRQITKLDDLTKLDLLNIEEKTITVANWKKWFKTFGIQIARSNWKITHNNYPLLIQSCLSGQGVMLGWHHMIYDYLQNGQLVRPVIESVKTENGFYLIKSTHKPLTPQASLFYNWILGCGKQQTSSQ